MLIFKELFFENSSKYRELVGDPPFHRHNDVESTITGGKIENKQSTNFAAFTYGIDMYKRNWKGDMYRDDTGAIFDDELIPDVDTYDYGVYVKADKAFDKWSLWGPAFVMTGLKQRPMKPSSRVPQ